MSLGLLLVGVYLVLVGIAGLFGLALPAWVVALVALVAGVLLLLEAGGVYDRQVGR